MNPEQWQRIKDTFALVVEQPAARRESLLRELCGDDPDLRQEVESLLKAHDDSGFAIPTDGYNIRATLGAGPVDFAGRSSGPYRIIREIGRGGMGAVFLAERVDDEFQRQVALKIVPGTLPDQEIELRSCVSERPGSGRAGL